jgi:hypothetical protein
MGKTSRVMTEVNQDRIRRSYYQTVASGNPVKVTRHFAALDFLLNIEMKNESNIRSDGMQAIRRMGELIGDGDASDGDDQFDDDDVGPSKLYSSMDPNFMTAPGRKLQGKSAPTGRIPALYRYKMLKMSDQSAVIRQWEASLLQDMEERHRKRIQNQQLQNPNKYANENASSSSSSSSRLFYSRSRGYPNVVSSVIGYAPEKENARIEAERARNEGLQVFQLPTRDWRGVTYHTLLKSSREMQIKKGDVYDDMHAHDPDALDDPEMIHGAAKYVQLGDSKMGPVISSVILFVNHEELKQELNEQFRERHQELPPSLTLSKIRKMKKTLLLVCMGMDIEVATVALACIYLEKLCLKGVVTKANRRLSMAICTMLAFKFNEQFLADPGVDEEPIVLAFNRNGNATQTTHKSKLSTFLEYVDREWQISKVQVLDAEFGAYVQLGFSLHVPFTHVVLVATRLLKLVHKSLRDYLGLEMHHVLNVLLQEKQGEHQRELREREIKEEEQDKEVHAVQERERERRSALKKRRKALEKESRRESKKGKKVQQAKEEASVVDKDKE